MKTLLHIPGLLMLLTGNGMAQLPDTLSVQQCRQLAEQNSPLQAKKLYAASISALQTSGLRVNDLPRIALGAQASWQNDVFGLPIESPAFRIPTVPKDQYKVSVDMSQRIFDGGANRYLRQQRSLDSELAAAQVDVEVFNLRELVTDLYFKALLLQELEAILSAGKTDLQSRLKQAEALVAEGAALRTSADQVRIQSLKMEQQLDGANADKRAMLDILAQWVGKPVVPTRIATDSSYTANFPAVNPALFPDQQRPEYQLFALQQRGFQISKTALALRSQPRLEAFAQGGIGRPNPFNFFETGFQPFVLLGLRAAWTPFDWGQRNRDAQVLELQIQNVEAQQLSFKQRMNATTVKDRADIVKMRNAVVRDDAIIQLQADIVRRAEAQVKNGVMTMTDYLTQVDLLTQARLLRSTHVVQEAQAWEMLVAKTKGGE